MTLHEKFGTTVKEYDEMDAYDKNLMLMVSRQISSEINKDKPTNWMK